MKSGLVVVGLAVDAAAALDRGARGDLLAPAVEMRIVGEAEEVRGVVIGGALGDRAVPGEDRHVGDPVIVAGHEAMVGEVAVEDVILALGLHRVAVDGIFDLYRRVGVEMAEAAAEEGRAAHLPHQPATGRRCARRVGGQEGAEFLGEVEQDGAAFEHALGVRRVRAVEQGGDLAVGIERDEAAAELVAFADVDQPGVIFRAGVARGEQFLEQDGDLDPVGGAEAVELERVIADGQVLVVRGAGDRPVDAGELAAAGLVPLPHARAGHSRWSCGAPRAGWCREMGGARRSDKPIDPRSRRSRHYGAVVQAGIYPFRHSRGRLNFHD